MRSALACAVLSGALIGAVVFSGPAGAAPFDPAAATADYLARVPAADRARSDAYFEGGYWLQLWSYLAGLAVSFFLLHARWSARMRDLGERITRFRPLQTFLYWLEYLVVTTVLLFPLTVYKDFFREHRYGLATQTFGPWLADLVKGILVGAVLGGLLVVVVYAVIRRAQRSWWIWGTGVALVFLVFVVVIGPVFIAPIFNTYTRLEDESIRGPILRLARANGIGASDVFVVDASRQSTRISANVQGFLGTERISLNDNLLRRCTLPEIEAVMGHEMGHYVLHHVSKSVLFFGLLILLGFALLRASADRLLARWGGRWGVRGAGDVAGLPLLWAVFSSFAFLLTPVLNTYIRENESEADIFGLNASRQPEGFAEVAIKLGEYRKLAPGPLEELVFFDHPSGRTRILAAMRWKAENLEAGAAAPGGAQP